MVEVDLKQPFRFRVRGGAWRRLQAVDMRVEGAPASDDGGADTVSILKADHGAAANSSGGETEEENDEEDNEEVQEEAVAPPMEEYAEADVGDSPEDEGDDDLVSWLGDDAMDTVVAEAIGGG